MTLDVYRGRKTTIQQQPKLEELLGSESYPVSLPDHLIPNSGKNAYSHIIIKRFNLNVL